MGVLRGGQSAMNQYLRNMDRMIDAESHPVYVIQDKRALRDFAKIFGAELIVGDPETIRGGRAKKEKFTEHDADPKELAAGIKEEMEHSDDRALAKKTALDHLAEDPKYYSKLKRAMKKEPELLVYTKGVSKPPVGGGGKGQTKDEDTRTPHAYAERHKTPKGDWAYKSQSDDVLVVDL